MYRHSARPPAACVFEPSPSLYPGWMEFTPGEKEECAAWVQNRMPRSDWPVIPLSLFIWLWLPLVLLVEVARYVRHCVDSTWPRCRACGRRERRHEDLNHR